MKNLQVILLSFFSLLLFSCKDNRAENILPPLAISFDVESEVFFENEPVSFFNQVDGINIADEEDDSDEQVDDESLSGEPGSENDLSGDTEEGAGIEEGPYRFIWTFGDGTPQSYEKNPTHIFKTARTYAVRLRVENTDGGIGSYVRQITVRKYDETIDRQRVKSQWNTPSLIREIAPGVIFKRLIFSKDAGNFIFNSNQYVNIIEVDLSANSNLKFAIAFPGNGKTSLTTVEAINRNALAAVNGTMGSWVSASQAEFLKSTAFVGTVPLPLWSESIVAGNNCLDYIRGYNTAGTELRFEVPNFAGATFSGGKVNRADRRTGVLKIDQKGQLTMECTHKKEINYEYELPHTYKHVMASGPMLVNDGIVWAMASNELNDSRNPRTAIGIMPDGKVLMVAVDGRRATKGAAGMTLRTELSKFLDWIGCQYAMNLDGGGSTTIYARDNVSDLADPLDNGILNHPTDNKEYDDQGNLTFDNKGERSQGGGFIILLDEHSTPIL